MIIGKGFMAIVNTTTRMAYGYPICNNNRKFSVKGAILVIIIENSALGTVMTELLLTIEVDV
jgi:hypothetical protein